MTDLPRSPTEWNPTPQLRWLKESTANFYSMTLQQKWVEVAVWRVDPDLNSQTIRRPTGNEDWRTVPTEDAP